MTKRDRHEQFILSSRERESKLLAENAALKKQLREVQQKYLNLLCEKILTESNGTIEESEENNV